MDGGIEEAADHGYAAVLDLGCAGVLFVVDEVLGQGLGHEVLGFFLLGCVSVVHFRSKLTRRLVSPIMTSMAPTTIYTHKTTNKFQLTIKVVTKLAKLRQPSA